MPHILSTSGWLYSYMTHSAFRMCTLGPKFPIYGYWYLDPRGPPPPRRPTYPHRGVSWAGTAEEKGRRVQGETGSPLTQYRRPLGGCKSRSTFAFNNPHQMLFLEFRICGFDFLDPPESLGPQRKARRPQMRLFKINSHLRGAVRKVPDIRPMSDSQIGSSLTAKSFMTVAQMSQPMSATLAL